MAEKIYDNHYVARKHYHSIEDLPVGFGPGYIVDYTTLMGILSTFSGGAGAPLTLTASETIPLHALVGITSTGMSCLADANMPYHCIGIAKTPGIAGSAHEVLISPHATPLAIPDVTPADVGKTVFLGTFGLGSCHPPGGPPPPGSSRIIQQVGTLLEVNPSRMLFHPSLPIYDLA